MFSLLFSAFSAFLLVLSHLANAAPVKPTEFIAFAPTITSPTNATIWPAGSNQDVNWKIDNVPDEARNYTLTFLLGYLDNNSENLDIKNPLATQIPILQGTVNVNVPANATYRTDYIVVCIGDSGDASPPFTITPSVALH